MSADPPAPQGRDAARSREAILDAAERLFAELGYDAASLEAIGHAAGVSRGTPRYFFGAKQALYRAVLARLLTAEADLLLEAQARTTVAGGGADVMLTVVVDSFLEFLVARPSFVRIVEREAASGGQTLREVAAETPAVQAGLTSLGEFFMSPPFLAREPAHLLLSLLALCWFPLAHADTFVRGMGIDPDSPEFLPAWKRQVVALVLRGVTAPS